MEQENGFGEGQKLSKKARVVEVEDGLEWDDEFWVLGLAWR